MATYTYSGTSADNYASNWYNSYNPNYPNYSSDFGGGGDCANFVSQCIHAGGIPMKTTGGDSDRADYHWCASQTTASQAWRGAGSLRRHIKYGTVGQRWNFTSLAADEYLSLRKGDIVFKLKDGYTNRNDDVTHVGIVDRVEPGKIYTYEHSPQAHRVWPYTTAQTIMYQLHSCEVTSGGSGGGTGGSSSYGTWEAKYGNNTFVNSSSYSGNVYRVQRDLNRWGVSPALVEDGKWGAKSSAATRQFQSANGLSVDGLCGPNTKSKLFNVIGRYYD